jgi:hypothetical protein
VPSGEASKREPVALVSDTALPHRAELDTYIVGLSLLRSSTAKRLGLVAAAIAILWLAVYWALR